MDMTPRLNSEENEKTLSDPNSSVIRAFQAEFGKEMKANFDKRTEGFVYNSPINEKIKEPVGLPDKMRDFGTLLELYKESIIKTAEDDQFKPDSSK